MRAQLDVLEAIGVTWAVLPVLGVSQAPRGVVRALAPTRR